MILEKICLSNAATWDHHFWLRSYKRIQTKLKNKVIIKRKQAAPVSNKVSKTNAYPLTIDPFMYFRFWVMSWNISSTRNLPIIWNDMTQLRQKEFRRQLIHKRILDIHDWHRSLTFHCQFLSAATQKVKQYPFKRSDI